MRKNDIQQLAEKYGRSIYNYSDGSAKFIVGPYEVMVEQYGNHYMLFHYTKGFDNRYFETIKEVEEYLKRLDRGL
jgi:hypothetical protein